MKAHTEGPWKLEGNWVDGKLGGWISTLHPSPLFELIPITGTKDEIIANAHLLVAAPDMKKALLQWKCPACGGSGGYHQNRAGTERKIEQGQPLDPHFNPDRVECKICEGSGLHPTARAAISKASTP